MANSNTASSNKISLSADIVAAYVSRNSVTPVGLPALIESVHGALSKLGAAEAVPKTMTSATVGGGGAIDVAPRVRR